jgi:hypothetical protein
MIVNIYYSLVWCTLRTSLPFQLIFVILRKNFWGLSFYLTNETTYYSFLSENSDVDCVPVPTTYALLSSIVIFPYVNME